MALCEYIKSFKHLLREADPSFVPPPSLPKEVIDDVETIREIAQYSREWEEDVFAAVGKFIEDLARLHSIFVDLLNRLEVADGLWENVHIY